MALDRRPRGLCMLTILAINGIAHEVWVVQDFGMTNVDIASLRLLVWLDHA